VISIPNSIYVIQLPRKKRKRKEKKLREKAKKLNETNQLKLIPDCSLSFFFI
jgi:hypothetical protein